MDYTDEEIAECESYYNDDEDKEMNL